jgi:hypothetical protein
MGIFEIERRDYPLEVPFSVRKKERRLAGWQIKNNFRELKYWRYAFVRDIIG